MSRSVGVESNPILLSRTRQRAEDLRTFLKSTSGTGFRSDESSFLSKTFEIFVCEDLATAFIHVYKAAGTTGLWYLDSICGARPARYVSWRDACQGQARQYYCMKRTRNADEMFKGINHTFTIVRDPMDRFQSGVFELAHRRDPGMRTWLRKANERNVSVGSVVIEDLFKMRAKSIVPEAHLMPQTYFLSHIGGLPVPKLSYVVKVGPDMELELAAIAAELGRIAFADSLVNEANMRLSMLPHMRDSRDPAYSMGLASLRSETLEPETRASVFRYYYEDYAWIGNMRRS